MQTHARHHGRPDFRLSLLVGLALALAACGSVGAPDLVGRNTLTAGPDAFDAGMPEGGDVVAGDAGAEAPGNSADQRSMSLTPAVRALAARHITELSAEDEATRSRASRALEAIGPAVVPLLEAAVSDANATEVTALIAKIKATDTAADAAGAPAVGGEGGSAPGASQSQPAATGGDGSGGASSGGDGPAPAGGGWLSWRNLIDRRLLDPVQNPGAIATYLWTRVQAARDAYARADYKGAKALAEAILTLEPAFRQRQALTALINACAERLQSAALLRGRVTAVTPEVTYGEPLTFRLALKNVTSRILTVTFSRDEARRDLRDERFYSPCVVYTSFVHWSDPRAPSRTTNSETLRISGEAELAPGETWVKTYTIPTESRGAEIAAIGRYTVWAELRPLSVTIEGKQVGVRILHLEEATARVLPIGYRAVREHPMQSLTGAIARADPVRIFMAAYAIEDHELKPAVAALIEALKTAAPSARTACFFALNTLTGYTLGGNDERLWREWFRANKDKPRLGIPRRRTPADDTGDTGDTGGG